MKAVPSLLGCIIIPILTLAALLARQWLLRFYRIVHTPLVPIGMLSSDTPVAVVGRATTAPLRSPLSNRACAFWLIEVQTIAGKATTTIFKQSSTEPLTITDGTGQVEILPCDADLILDDDRIFPDKRTRNIPAQVATVLDQMGVSMRGPWGLKRDLVVRERYITPDDAIFALGVATLSGSQTVFQSVSDQSLIIADRAKPELMRKLIVQMAIALIGLVGVLGFYVWMLW